MNKHTADHKTIIVGDKMHCLECEIKETPHIEEAYDHEGKTYYVCSACQMDIEESTQADGPDDYVKVPFCTNHGFIEY